MHTGFYDKNLNALKHINPYLYWKLCNVKENTKFNVFATNDPININLQEVSSKSMLYKNPLKDLEQEIIALQSINRYHFLVYFGIGNGILAKVILENFQFLTTLYIVEPEIEILFIALHVVDFSKDILSFKLRIMLPEQVEYPVVRQFLVEDKLLAYLRLYDMKINRPFYAKYQEELIRINKIFIDAIEHFVKSHGNCSKDSLIGSEHFIANMPLMLKSIPFHEILNYKPSETAILVSTGPSLTKQLELLKTAQNKATIIAVDASMPVLEKNGIKPDIVCSIERVVETAKFFESTSAEFHKDITFVCAALQHKKVFENIKDGQLIVAMRPFNFMRHFEFHNYGYCGIGMSAANLAFDVAFLVGFKNLIFIGQDLAYAPDGKSHAKDHVYGEDEKTNEYNASLTLPAWGGEGTVVTTEVWSLFRNFFITNIAEAKGKMDAINATEGGARIDGAKEMSFKEALEKFVYPLPEKKKIVLNKTPQATAAVLIASAKFKVDNVLDYAKTTYSDIESIFNELNSFCDEVVQLNNAGKTADIDFEQMESLTKKIEDIKERFNDTMFYDIFWEVVQSFILSQELILATILVKPVSNDIEKKIKMVEFLFAHKQWLYMLLGSIDIMIKTITKAKEDLDKQAILSEEYLNNIIE